MLKKICIIFCITVFAATGYAEKIRCIIETDAGGDPDDEASLVRWFLYANEWDIEGIIATRPVTRSDNPNPLPTGLAIVQSYVNAYGEVYDSLKQHKADFPAKQFLWDRTVAGYNTVDDGVNLIIAAVDKADPRPVWFSNWGADDGTKSSLWRALDKVLAERGQAGYEAFKNKIRINGDPKFGAHDTSIIPLWRILTYTKCGTYPCEAFGSRWYHRFEPLTYNAGGFNITADVLTNHGPLGALYTIQKEGDTHEFLLVIPNGLCEPMRPQWGGWAGRYSATDNGPYARGPQYTWPDQQDAWQGSTNRDNTLKRWAVHLQNDFKARMDWCVKGFSQANHEPVPVVNGSDDLTHLTIEASPGSTVPLSAAGSSDPDGNALSYVWEYYREAGTYNGLVHIADSTAQTANVLVPSDIDDTDTIHVVLIVTDNGSPALTRYRRVLIVKQSHTRAAPAPASPEWDCPIMEACPNPLNPSTRITIHGRVIAGEEMIEINILNIHGKRLQKLSAARLASRANCQLPTCITWDASHLPSGMYIARAQIGAQTMEKRLILMK
ncbi:MAG: hypothetical protein A2268_07385 [Candidatus Raymondbacteria bacterium RifOxyA12_full_50_37]|uniref:DUF1593 domain-containing protein n=1 Tax=Candidatus Raymondbacteria bacterium RIFOXYD12_FULL_49_13 TaxID=1817890 RepID=A0A1F7F5X6_UNCRA|nr:MAG: hypothetical protein A2268_07385 [Candidatus Raymondbacteria bacterium RifOxyA12_full_50_37]OGJ91204.1 MAG: hypothetical protein A2248_01530 [Candidatus Raymondbacteria bacterium RIFOXYA2_FULL_49_16]OGJ95379.1 MAG: hypothetical protein A2487_18110 [Candidatus Raymondbacteria bacterium RifOxyC12_full_50_8]OGJ97602.1 MAG: hypothetical protein A2453_02295 [Candidatus Raymondbacteria bacterium RIFOXYC2_FULL_50_21]OGK02060.1 MAG: hypothetical protein A2519_18740 [Candidatus Raymondbacteria b